MIFSMVVQKEESKQSIEPQFLAQAQQKGVTVRIGQMNKTERVGIIRDIGRYEINLEENGRIITLLKQEISYLAVSQSNSLIPAQQPVIAEEGSPEPSTGSKPNIQQEFLDKAIRENQILTLYLINGQRFKATITAYDNFTILLTEDDKQHLYYKHAITTINR